MNTTTISTLYALKLFTSAKYSSYAQTAKTFSVSLSKEIALMAKQDLNHAKILYAYIQEDEKLQPIFYGSLNFNKENRAYPRENIILICKDVLEQEEAYRNEFSSLKLEELTFISFNRYTRFTHFLQAIEGNYFFSSDEEKRYCCSRCGYPMKATPLRDFFVAPESCSCCQAEQNFLIKE